MRDYYDDNVQIERVGFDEKPAPPAWKGILEYAIFLGIVVAVCFLIIKFVAIRSVVDGVSMNPTLQHGDNLIVEKVSYYFHEPERFDIIVFEPYEGENTHYIKRVIGLPGETVQIINGRVHINGELLETDVYGYAIIGNPGIADEPITVGPDEVFVLGDNRNDSMDSRFAKVGMVSYDRILGRAMLRFWPFNAITLLGDK